MAKTLSALRAELAGKQTILAGYLAERKTDSGEYAMPHSDVEEVRRQNTELKALSEQIAGLEEAEAIASSINQTEQKAANQPRGRNSQPDTVEAKAFSVDRMLSESKAYAAFQRGEVKTVRFSLDPAETKTLLTLSDIAPQNDRRGFIVPSAQAYVPVSDLFVQGTTMSTALEYYEETTFTNAAAERAEGDAAAESALDFTLRTDSIRSVATWLPATLEVLADNGRLASYIDGRLRFMVAKKRDAQLLIGDGTAPNLSGITDRTIQTQAKGADPTFDAIMKAITKVRVTGDAEPDAIILHPNDWEALLLTRTTDGIYILGNPGDPGISRRLWGLQVRSVPALTENTGLVGAFGTMASFVRRSGLEIMISTEHSTYFTERKMAILAEERVGIEVYRPYGFCSVTGI